ncbi:MAG: PPC domain-containing protein, partial [Gemmatimonadota bacterium]
MTDILRVMTCTPARRLTTAVLLVAAALSQSTCRLDELLSPPPAGLLEISKEVIAESSAVGSTLPRTTSVNLANPGERQQSWIVTRAQLSDWLEVDPTSGTAPSTVSLTLDPSGLALGVHRDTLIFSGGSGALDPMRLPVEFSITPCLTITLRPDTVVADSLGRADCTAPHRANSYAKVYRFDASAGDSVSVFMRSSDFDAFLGLDSAADGSSTVLSEADGCVGDADDPCLIYVLLPEAGDYFIEATTYDRRETGSFTLEVRPPRAPDAPTDLAQVRSDSITTVTLGATVSDTVFVFQGVVDDPDLGDSLRLQVEIQPIDSTFGGTPSGSSEFGAGGDTLLLTVAGFADDTRYHWRARTVDQTGRGSSWAQFGENPEGEPDFAVALQEVPESPIGLGQYRSDATTPISIGGTTSEPTVVISGEVNDPDPFDQVRLEVEVRPVGTPFSNTATGSSVLLA